MIVLEKDTRYYKIDCVNTLFEDFRVERIYGRKANKTPTGIVIKNFDTQAEAQNHIAQILNLKTKRGYSLLSQASM